MIRRVILKKVVFLTKGKWLIRVAAHKQGLLVFGEEGGKL